METHEPQPGETEDAPGSGALWDERYRSAPRLFRAEADETLVELVSGRPPGRALDLGAGEGRNSLWLARQGWHVVAVDASVVALERLQDAAEGDGLVVETVRADAFEFLDRVGEGAGFDLVVVAFMQLPPDERAMLLRASGGVIAPAGALFVVAHHLASLGLSGPPDPARLYTEDDLRTAAAGLRILRLEQRRGPSDVSESGVDVILWAERPGEA